jgi:ABC-type amino acid transport substrate-binding protein
MLVSYDLTLYFNQNAVDEDKTPVPFITDFAFRLNKQCTEQEWIDVMTLANAGMITQEWLEELIDLEIGQGYTEIV